MEKYYLLPEKIPSTLFFVCPRHSLSTATSLKGAGIFATDLETRLPSHDPQGLAHLLRAHDLRPTTPTPFISIFDSLEGGVAEARELFGDVALVYCKISGAQLLELGAKAVELSDLLGSARNSQVRELLVWRSIPPSAVSSCEDLSSDESRKVEFGEFPTEIAKERRQDVQEHQGVAETVKVASTIPTVKCHTENKTTDGDAKGDGLGAEGDVFMSGTPTPVTRKRMKTQKPSQETDTSMPKVISEVGERNSISDECTSSSTESVKKRPSTRSRAIMYKSPTPAHATSRNASSSWTDFDFLNDTSNTNRYTNSSAMTPPVTPDANTVDMTSSPTTRGQNFHFEVKGSRSTPVQRSGRMGSPPIFLTPSPRTETKSGKGKKSTASEPRTALTPTRMVTLSAQESWDVKSILNDRELEDGSVELEVEWQATWVKERNVGKTLKKGYWERKRRKR